MTPQLAMAPLEEKEKQWPNRKMTLKRVIALTCLWALCFIMPPLAVILGALFGAVKGVAEGAYDGLSATYQDLRRWWQMFEES